MQLIDCTLEHQAAAILAIFNHAIITSTALYDYEPRDDEFMRNWFATKAANKFPVIGALNEAGELMGFASYGSFRAFAGYKFTLEHSVYIHPEHQRKGLGKVLLQALIERARNQGYHVMLGVIDEQNSGSIALHRQLGFSEQARLPQIGFKFGRWLDVVIYHKLLQTDETDSAELAPSSQP